MASQRARHPGTPADRCSRSFPQQAVRPECHPQWPWGTCPLVVLPHRGPRADVGLPALLQGSQEPPGHLLWVLSRPGRQATCMGLLQRPWGPSCCRQGPDRWDAPTTLMLESLPKGLPGRVMMDCLAPSGPPASAQGGLTGVRDTCEQPALGSYAEGVCLARGPYPHSWPGAWRGRGEQAGVPGGTSWLAVRYFLSENMAVQNLIITLMSSRSCFSP